jgi:two-component system cell cycle sensor histidine kinase/response regulator CckA
MTLRQNAANHQIQHDEATRYIQELSLLNHVLAALNEEVELPSLILNLIASITEIFGYSPIGFYLLKDEVLQNIHHLGGSGIVEEIPIHLGVTGRAARTGKPILVEDVRTDPDYIGTVGNVTSEISVPIFDHKEVIGVLNVDSTDGIKLTQADLMLISLICEQVSGAINRARLFTGIKTQARQFQSIFELAPISMAISSPNGAFIRVNNAFKSLLGYSIQDLNNLSVSQITHPDDLDKNTGWGHRLFSNEIESYQFEKRYVHKNGSIINALLTVSLLPIQGEQHPHYIAQIVDLTALKLAESALLQHQKMESLGTLASGIAHDFNNLLVAMKAQSSLALIKLPAESEARKHIEKTKMAADSAAQLTEQLLAYSGQSQFKIKQIDLNHEVHKNSQILEMAIPKNAQLHTHLAHNLPQIMADGGQIQQVLMNLIINGVESLEGQPGIIRLSTEQTNIMLAEINAIGFIVAPPAPGSFIKIIVSDNGCGMDRKTASKIFDPFFSTKFSGRGLGLAAVLGIVKSYHGGLVVESEVGLGTKFSIYFPIAAEQKTRKVPEEAPKGLSSPLKTKTKELLDSYVLLIDDDHVVRETMVDLFQFEGIPLIYATNGSEGISQLQLHKDQVKLVILDLSMPGISSEETFIQLRQIKQDLPILLCSGFSEHKIGDYFSNQDYGGFIAKPFEIDKLFKTVRDFLTV